VDEVIRRLVRRLRSDERGASLVEFSIIAMLLFLLIFGLIEFGWIFNGYVTLTSAAQEGARMAIVMNKSDADKKAIINTVQSHAKIFNLSHVLDDDISIHIAKDVGEETKVSIEGKLDLLIAFPPLPQSIALSTEATMRQEQ